MLRLISLVVALAVVGVQSVGAHSIDDLSSHSPTGLRLADDRADPGSVHAHYNPVTGVIWVDANNMNMIRLLSSSGSIVDDPESVVTYFGGADPFVLFKHLSQFEVLWGETRNDLIGLTPETGRDGGALLAPGTPVSDLTLLGRVPGGQDFTAGQIFVVPEPSSTWMAVIAAIGLCFLYKKHVTGQFPQCA